MSIFQRGEDTHLVRVYVGRDPITKKRIEVNETVHGSYSYAVKRETKLKAQKYAGQLLRSPRMTVDKLFNLYLDSARYTLGVATYDHYSASYRRYAQPYIGNILIDKIKHSDIQQLFNFMLDPKQGAEKDKNKDERTSAGLGISAQTVKAHRNVLSCAFNFAVENGLIAENPVSKTKVIVRKKTIATSLTVEEARAFVSVKDHFWYGAAFVFQLHTGLRNQELMALIWDDVDFEKSTLRIERACKRVKGACVEIGPPKTERSNRVIKLEPEHLVLLQDHFKAQQETSQRYGHSDACGNNAIEDWIRRERPRCTHLYSKTNLIFAKRDGGIPSACNLQHAFKRMLRHAGIGRSFRLYDLRHTHASILFAAGVPPIDIAQRMGHSLAECMRTYGHALKDRIGVPSRVFTDLIPV